MGRWQSVFAFFACLAGALLCVGSAAPRTDTSDPQLPSWIREISPHGSVDTLAQIRVLFNTPVIPLEAVESPDRQTKLRFFHVEPALPGRFIFLTPRMVGFQMDRALPLATHVTVTVDRGLSDLSGHSLSSDLTWSFETTPVSIGITGLEDIGGIPLDPPITLVANTRLDIESLRQHTTLTGPGGVTVPLDIEFEKDQAFWGSWPGTLFDPSLREWYYSAKVRQALARSTNYSLAIAPGVKPADGNMPSATDFTMPFQTYAPLSFEGLTTNGPSFMLGSRFGNPNIWLGFNNTLDPASVLKHISVSPRPQGTEPLFETSWRPTGERMDGNLLDPQTTYTFTMDADLMDKFGQTLGRREVATYTTGDLNPDLWSISDYNIFAPALGVRLNLIARNLPDGRYQASYRRLNPLDFTYDDESDLLPDHQTWPDVRLRLPTNRTEDITLPLNKLLDGQKGALAYGLTAKFPDYDENRWSGEHPIPVYGIAQVTDLGLYVQVTPDAGFVRTQRLSDGESVDGVSVDVYALQGGTKKRSLATPCASATTDALGAALLTGAAWLRCVKTDATGWGAPPLLVVARTASDWTLVRTDGGVPLGFGWERGPSARGDLFSDRDLYQPGETAQFTGIAYYEEAGSIHRDSNSRYSLTLRSPDGSVSSLGTTTTDDYGAFSLRVPLKPSQTVGMYYIQAKSSKGLDIGGHFTVAQFTPPNFEVHLSLDKALAFQGETVALESATKYLFGVPMTNAKTTFHATRSQTQFTPPGWDDFSFGRTWWWIDSPPPPLDGGVLDVTSQVDAQGRARASISVPPVVPYPVRYDVDATTTDVSNRSVADSASFVALPSDALIGVKGPWVARTGKPISIQAIVVDHNGKTLAGRGVTSVLARVDYSGAAASSHYVTVDSHTTTSSPSAVQMTLAAPTAGTYRIQTNFAGSTNSATATDTFVWVSGPGAVDWGTDNNANTGLTIRLDKKRYHAGDTATAIVEAPFVPADLYFSVVKHGLLFHTIVPVTGNAPEVQFTVTQQMLPNSEIEAVLMRKGTPLSKTTATTQGDIVRYGSVALAQDLDDRYLHVSARPVHATVEPGKTQTLDFAVTDIHGQPERAEIAVMVVNDDILQVTGYRPPDLVASVYSSQPISSEVIDDRSFMLFQQPNEQSFQYYGARVLGAITTGDTYTVLEKSSSNAAAPPPPASRSVYIRTNFKKLAYYDLAVRTDTDGKASVTFKMPDDLTRWRVFAEASGAAAKGDDGDYRFGYGESTFIATKPLLTNPLLPQFVRPGDSFEGGLSVTSGHGATGMLSIKGLLNGPLSFGSGQATHSLDVAMQAGTQAFRFPITVSSVAPATIQFTTQLGQEGDAFRVPLALTPLEISEQIIDSGATTTGARIQLRVDPKVDDRAGGLQLSIASTLLPQITVPAEQMLAEPCLPFLMEAAAQLSAAADMQMIADRYGQRFPSLDLRAIAARNLEVYQKLQRSDSGFSDWPSSKWLDPYSNGYAAEALARAKRAGFTVDPSFIDSSKKILRDVAKDPSPFDSICDEPCLESIRLHALVALAALGETHTEDLPAVYAQRDNFSYVDRLLLARYLSALPSWKAQADALAVKLSETIYETGRYATVNQQDASWWWWWSGTESQAQAIRLYSSRPASADFRDRLVRGLLAQRRKGAWSNTFDTAEALDALVDYLALESSPPKFDATASVAGRTVVAARFEGYQQPLRETTIGMASLPRGLSNVDLRKTGTGTLHYVIAYRYRLQGAQPGAMEGIRIDRLLHPVNGQSVIATIGVAPQEKPLTLPPGQVYDVELVIVADHPLDQVVITDPLPAGMEAVDSSFKTATPYFRPLASAWNIDYTEIYRDRVVAFADRLGAGVYSFHYLVRTVTPGTFLWPGADAHLEFAPEQFGRTASSTLRVSM